MKDFNTATLQGDKAWSCDGAEGIPRMLEDPGAPSGNGSGQSLPVASLERKGTIASVDPSAGAANPSCDGSRA